jgi:catechol 2,3-dioxygenase-like lactoylglutathione lyase family enzyme
MSTTEQPSSASAQDATPATSLPLRLEVVTLPVADVDRAKAFYAGLGWRLDVDAGGGGFRAVHLTPPASDASIVFGEGVTSAQPGSIDRILLAVDDLAAATEELRSRGADVSEPFHAASGGLEGGFHANPEERAAGPDPEGRSYATYATFQDPDGNVWMLQEIGERLPGRLWEDEGDAAAAPTVADIETLAGLMREAAEQHDSFEKSTAEHGWWDWYAPYLSARQRGSTPDEAIAEADRHMTEVHGISRR